MKSSTELLLRIHRLLNSLGGPAPLRRSTLDSVSREILLHVSKAEQDGERLKISDVRFDPSYGSPVTALKRLNVLIDAGWITLTADLTDSRAQRLELSTKAKEQIEFIAKEVRAATKE